MQKVGETNKKTPKGSTLFFNLPTSNTIKIKENKKKQQQANNKTVPQLERCS